MSEISQRNRHRQQRTLRTRAKLHGTAVRPRISVFRSNQYIWVQAIDDDAQTTLAAATDQTVRRGKGASSKTGSSKTAGTKTASATAVGTTLAQELKQHNINQAIFDRGFYRYHGRVAAVATALREAGIQV